MSPKSIAGLKGVVTAKGEIWKVLYRVYFSIHFTKSSVCKQRPNAPGERSA